MWYNISKAGFSILYVGQIKEEAVNADIYIHLVNFIQTIMLIIVTLCFGRIRHRIIKLEQPSQDN